MTHLGITLRGEHVILRDINPDDLESLRKWRNRSDYRQYFREFRDISPAMQRDWYGQIVCNDPRVRMFAITDKTSGRLLGACGLCYIDLQNHSADFSIYIGADDLYIDQKLAPDAGKLLLAYGFETLGLHRIWAEIYAIDQAKQVLLPGLGFVLDGRHREAHQLEDRNWTDCLFYGILRHEFAGQSGMAKTT
ncbi:MAG: GNAT family N-acetyltransferase [Robiginitomaculum sp.]|nr:MAG: GNAT family N-acetyltransferase [Robiginitomaculum sp.]